MSYVLPPSDHYIETDGVRSVTDDTPSSYNRGRSKFLLLYDDRDDVCLPIDALAGLAAADAQVCYDR